MIFYLKGKIFAVWSSTQPENFIKEGYYAFYTKEFQFNIYDVKANVKKIFSKQYDKTIFNRRYNYGIENGKLIFSLDNELRELDLINFSSRLTHSTSEERVTLLNEFLYLGSSSKRKKSFKLINREDSKMIYKWEDNKNILHYQNSIYLFCTGYSGDLFRVDIKTDKILWRMKLGEMFLGNRFLKEYKKDLIIWIEPHNLISINKDTGIKNWELPNIRMEIMEMDEHTLCTFSHFHLMIIDLKKGKQEIFDIQEEFAKKNLRYLKSTFKNGKIYFSNMTKLGVFNIENLKIEWLRDFEEEMSELDYDFKAAFHEPIVHENRIYVKDGGDTLWILEKMNE